MSDGKIQNPRFARFAIGTLAYTVATILWGAWVRITGSGLAAEATGQPATAR